jgi:uncharacterized protein YjbJ (UPF0337 family)
MNRDRVKGAIDQAVGRSKRKVGALAGDTPLQVEGMIQQVKGKVETAWGKAKDAVDAANEEAEVRHESRIEVGVENAATGIRRP